MHKVQLFPTSEALYHGAAEYWISSARAAIKRAGAFHVALAGGSTPRGLYQLLASASYVGQVDWNRVYIYFSDERYVPSDHPESNYRMARLALLDKVSVPPGQIFRIPTELPNPEAAADDYTQTLRAHLPQGRRLDLILLGVGADGHTASLFPDTSILSVCDRLAAAVYVEKLNAWRISMTYPAIDQSRQIVCLVSGSAKAPIMASILAAPTGKIFPVQGLQPSGELNWFLDKAAACEWETQL